MSKEITADRAAAIASAARQAILEDVYAEIVRRAQDGKNFLTYNVLDHRLQDIDNWVGALIMNGFKVFKVEIEGSNNVESLKISW